MHRRTFLSRSLSWGLATTAGSLSLLHGGAKADEPGPYARLTAEDNYTRWAHPLRFHYILTNPTTRPLILDLCPDSLIITAGRNAIVFHEPVSAGIGKPDHDYVVCWQGTLEPEQPLISPHRLVVAPGGTRSFVGQWTPHAKGGLKGEIEMRAWLKAPDTPVLPTSMPVYVDGPEASPNEAPVLLSIAALIDVSKADRGRARIDHAYSVAGTYVGTPRANRTQPTSPQDWLIEENGKQIYVAWRKENETWLRMLRPGSQVHVTGRLRRSPQGTFYLEPDAMGVLPMGP